MIGLDQVLLEVHELRRDDLQSWIANAWIRPQGPPERYQFQDIDIARIRLIVELRGTLEVNDAALPTVLSLLDQLYDMRRRMRRLNQAMADTVPAPLRDQLLALLSAPL